MPSASQIRAREQFLLACENPEHPYAGMSPSEVHAEEKGRKPVPNRAALRRHGVRSGYTQRLAQRLAMAAEIRRVDRADDTAAMQAARAARKVQAPA